MNWTDILLIVINLAGALSVFLFAMKIMSEGLQKLAGSRMRSVLARITDRPFSGIMTGMAVTAAIQSSSATTVMVVSFVNAGLLSLGGAVAVIMGANIGTTVTAWIITLLGLEQGSGYFSLPLLIAAVSLVFFFMKHERSKHVAQTVVGLSLLLVGMQYLQNSMPDLSKYPALLHGIASLSNYGFWSVLIFIVIGAVLTCIVQASAAMMAITLVMCYNGWIGLDMAVALVMGQNIGTTITANIAASVANNAGKKAAMAHFVFNVLGVLITLVFFRPITNIIEHVFPTDIPMAISLFHTIFNVGNTLILVWFIPQIIWIVNHVVKDKATGETEENYRLTYISGGPVGTSELSLQAARRELQLFSKQVLRMYALLPAVATAKNEKEFAPTMNEIDRYEHLCDNMEREITVYLTAVNAGGLSAHGSERVSEMLRVADNLESIGDSIYQISLTRHGKLENGIHFSDTLNANMRQMSLCVENALMVMDTNLADFDHANLDLANEAENEVNRLRDRLRAENIEALRHNEYNYGVAVSYGNLISQYEKLADHAINISEAICKRKA